MNQATMIRAMKTSISEVLEKMFFLPIDFLDSIDGHQHITEADCFLASLSFDGDPSGCFFLCMPSSLAGSVSADFLGIREGDVTKEHITGTVQEMINMLAGNTLSNYDAQAVFNLRIPQLIEETQMGVALESFDYHWGMGIATLSSRMTLILAS